MKFLFLSLSRSGHHAIINWIAEHLESGSIHYNNCYFSENFANISPKDNEIVYYKDKINVQNEIWNHESFDPVEYKGIKLDSFDHIFLVMRDCYNWAASFYKWKPNLFYRFQNSYQPKKPNCKKNSMLQMWKNQAKEVLGINRFCKFSFEFINYNRWAQDVEYRGNIIRGLGLKFSDTGFNKVPNFANGSSFDKLSYNNQAANMDLFNRWEYFKDDDKFMKLFEDQELVVLNKYLFDDYSR